MLTEQEKKLIISALAFASSEDVIADFTPSEEQALCELAVKLREDYDIMEVDSVYIPYKSKSDMEKHATDLDIVKNYTEFINFE
jgi:hypothetical protein